MISFITRGEPDCFNSLHSSLLEPELNPNAIFMQLFEQNHVCSIDATQAAATKLPQSAQYPNGLSLSIVESH
jgi:hypothetical protein